MCVYVDVCLFTILEKGHENKSETLLNTLHILSLAIVIQPSDPILQMGKLRHREVKKQ